MPGTSGPQVSGKDLMGLAKTKAGALQCVWSEVRCLGVIPRPRLLSAVDAALVSTFPMTREGKECALLLESIYLISRYPTSDLKGTHSPEYLSVSLLSISLRV